MGSRMGHDPGAEQGRRESQGEGGKEGAFWGYWLLNGLEARAAHSQELLGSPAGFQAWAM